MAGPILCPPDATKERGTALDADFKYHPYAEILRSPPGLGLIFGSQMLGEPGDDRTLFF